MSCVLWSKCTDPQGYGVAWVDGKKVMAQSVIAAEYGVTQSCISNIKRRRNWAHI